MFMKSWAYLCKHGNKANLSLPPELTPSLDRSIIEDPTGLDLKFLNEWVAFTSRNLKIWEEIRSVPDHMVRATFEFTREGIKKLREKVLFKVDDAKPLHLSTFVLTLAYTATCLVKAKGGEGDRLVRIVFAADCRSRLVPPLPITYFGNCIVGAGSSAKASDFLDKNGFAFAINIISDLIEGLKKGFLNVAEEMVRQFFTSKVPGLQLISVAGSPRFEFYDSDFGVGRLKKVEIASIDRNAAISMIDSRDGSGGVEIGVILNKHEMGNSAFLFSEGLKTTSQL